MPLNKHTIAFSDDCEALDATRSGGPISEDPVYCTFLRPSQNTGLKADGCRQQKRKQSPADKGAVIGVHLELPYRVWPVPKNVQHGNPKREREITFTGGSVHSPSLTLRVAINCAGVGFFV